MCRLSRLGGSGLPEAPGHKGSGGPWGGYIPPLFSLRNHSFVGTRLGRGGWRGSRAPSREEPTETDGKPFGNFNDKRTLPRPSRSVQDIDPTLKSGRGRFRNPFSKSFLRRRMASEIPHLVFPFVESYQGPSM